MGIQIRLERQVMSSGVVQILRERAGCRPSGSIGRCRRSRSAARTSLPSKSGPRLARRNHDMHKAYIIEIGDEAVGIAARDQGGFRFHAALHALNDLNGRLFPSVLDATRAARALVDRGGPRASRAARTNEGRCA